MGQLLFEGVAVEAVLIVGLVGQPIDEVGLFVLNKRSKRREVKQERDGLVGVCFGNVEQVVKELEQGDGFATAGGAENEKGTLGG